MKDRTMQDRLDLLFTSNNTLSATLETKRNDLLTIINNESYQIKPKICNTEYSVYINPFEKDAEYIFDTIQQPINKSLELYQQGPVKSIDEQLKQSIQRTSINSPYEIRRLERSYRILTDEEVLQQRASEIKKQFCATLKVIQESKQLQQKEFKMALTKLATSVPAIVENFDCSSIVSSDQIDLYNSSTAISFGSGIMKNLSSFSDEMISHVTVQESGQIGEALQGLVIDLQSSNVDGLTKQPSILSKLPIIGAIFDTHKKLTVKFSTLATQVGNVSTMLEDTLRSLYIDMEMLEQLGITNKEHYAELTRLISLGEERLRVAKEEELPVMQKAANESGDMMELQNVKESKEQIDRFERRLYDLKVSQMMAVQTAPQIQLMLSNDISLAEKIQSSIHMVIPLWKNQMVLGLSIQKQQTSAALQRTISDKTNELMKQNSEMLKDASLTIAKEVERPIVDMETLSQTHQTLIKTLEETLSIATEGQQKRQRSMEEISKLDADLRSKIQSIVEAENKKALTISPAISKAKPKRVTSNHVAKAAAAITSNPPPPPTYTRPTTTSV